jgi:predicted nucleic acid-binding protein
MALVLTLDASVFVAAARRSEPGHAASRDLLSALRGAEIPLIEPALLPVEVASALARADGDPALARAYAEALLSLPLLTLLPLDERLARRALAIAAARRLRGADAVYVAAAAQYGARLVTLDEEQLRRASTDVAACPPATILKLLRT